MQKNKITSNQHKFYAIALWLIGQQAKKENVNISGTHLIKMPRQTIYDLVKTDDHTKIIGRVGFYTHQSPTVFFYQ